MNPSYNLWSVGPGLRGSNFPAEARPGAATLLFHVCGGDEGTGRSLNAVDKDRSGGRNFIAFGEVTFKWVCKRGSQFHGWPPSLCQPLTQGGPLTLWSQAGRPSYPGQGRRSIWKLALEFPAHTWVPRSGRHHRPSRVGEQVLFKSKRPSRGQVPPTPRRRLCSAS